MKLPLGMVCVLAGAASAGPLDVLKDSKRGWTYEVVTGTKVDDLAPSPGAAPVMCTSKVDDKVGTFERVMITCTPGKTKRRVVFLEDHTKTPDFDDIDVAKLEDFTNTTGMVFPRAPFKKTWTKQVKADGGASVTTTVTTRKVKVDKASHTAWLSETIWRGDKDRILGQFVDAVIPNVGPYLLCEQRDGEDTTLTCLRLISIEKAK